MQHQGVSHTEEANITSTLSNLKDLTDKNPDHKLMKTLSVVPGKDTGERLLKYILYFLQQYQPCRVFIGIASWRQFQWIPTWLMLMKKMQIYHYQNTQFRWNFDFSLMHVTHTIDENGSIN